MTPLNFVEKALLMVAGCYALCAVIDMLKEHVIAKMREKHMKRMIEIQLQEDGDGDEA